MSSEIDFIVEQRLAGLCLRYVRDTGASIDPTARAALQQGSFAWMAATMEARELGGHALGILDDAGITTLVSKGPGIAEFYPSVECRPYADLDIVVSPRDFGRSVRMLEASGWAEAERNVQPWAFFRWACREGVNMSPDIESSVDIHHRFPPWIWAENIDLERVRERARPARTVAGANCLAPVDNLLVAALHLVSDRNAPGRSLLIWRDIVQMASFVPAEAAARAASDARLAGWLRTVLAAMPEGVRPSELFRALPDEPLVHPARLSMLLSEQAAGLGVLASQFLRLPLTRGLAFTAGMLVPSPSFLRRRYAGSSHVYRRWWSDSTRRFSHHEAV